MPVSELRENEGMWRAMVQFNFYDRRNSTHLHDFFLHSPRGLQNLLAHGAKCQTKVQGGCNVCRRIWALLQIHARQCRKQNCQVPKCRQLKEQLRAIENQQAAMDERRRQAMNEQCESVRLTFIPPCRAMNDGESHFIPNILLVFA